MSMLLFTILYITGVIIVLFTFFMSYKKNDITWKRLIIGIIYSLGSWFSFAIMIIIALYITIIVFTEWFSSLEFWDKRVF